VWHCSICHRAEESVTIMFMSSCSSTDFLKLLFSSSPLHLKSHLHGTLRSVASAQRWEARAEQQHRLAQTHGDVEHPAKLPYLTRRLWTRDDDNLGWPGRLGDGSSAPWFAAATGSCSPHCCPLHKPEAA